MSETRDGGGDRHDAHRMPTCDTETYGNSTEGRLRTHPLRQRPRRPPVRPGRLRARRRAAWSHSTPPVPSRPPYGVVWDINRYAFIEQGSDQPRHGEPEPVATGPTERHPRPVRGGAGHLAGARLRHLQHHVHRRRDRLDHHRPAHRRAVREGVPRPRQRVPRRATGGGGHLHPLAHRPLRRRARRDHTGRRRRRSVPGHRPAALHARDARRERHRRLRDGPPSDVPVRSAAARPGRSQHVDCGLGKAIPFWPPGPHRAHRGDQRDRHRAGRSTACGWSSRSRPRPRHRPR